MSCTIEHVYYIRRLKVKPANFYPVLMSSINERDEQSVILKKMNAVAWFLEAFYVYRKASGRNTSHTIVGPDIFKMAVEIRGMTASKLGRFLDKKACAVVDPLAMAGLKLGVSNNWFVRYVLSRITSHVEEMSDGENKFVEYMSRKLDDPYSIEHLLPYKFDSHSDQFTDRDEFCKYRLMLGALVLLPESVNQSLSNSHYSKKIGTYRKENLLAASLDKKCYNENRGFVKYRRESSLPFKPYEKFGKVEIGERQRLYAGICAEIWDPVRIARGYVGRNTGASK